MPFYKISSLLKKSKNFLEQTLRQIYSSLKIFCAMKEEIDHHEPTIQAYSEASELTNGIKQEELYHPRPEYQVPHPLPHFTHHYRDYSILEHEDVQTTRDYCDNVKSQQYMDPAYNLSYHGKILTEERKVFETPKSILDYTYDYCSIPYGSSVTAYQDRPPASSYEQPGFHMKKKSPKASPSAYDDSAFSVKQEIKNIDDQPIIQEDNKESVKKESWTSNLKIEGIRETDLSPDKRPAYSYVALIAFALKMSPNKQLQLNSIYKWISDHFPYFKKLDSQQNSGWKNSIRHNLSLNECFQKVTRNGPGTGGGKGHFWMLDPMCEDMFENGKFTRRRKTKKFGVSVYQTGPYGGVNRLPMTKVEPSVWYSHMMSGGSQYSNFAQSPHHHYTYQPYYSHMNQTTAPLGGPYQSLNTSSLGGSSPFGPPYYNTNNAILPSSALTTNTSLSPGLSLTSGTSSVSNGNLNINSPYATNFNSSTLTTIPELPYTINAQNDLNSDIPSVLSSGISSHPGSPMVHPTYDTTDLSYNSCLMNVVKRGAVASPTLPIQSSSGGIGFDSYVPPATLCQRG